MQKIMLYIKNVYAEMVKVNWPTRSEVTGATTLVVVLTLILSLCVYVFDIVLNRIVGFLLNLHL